MPSKIYFRHGTLNSSKTANLLMIAHSYEQQGKKVIILKPSLDTRSNKGMVESRVGISHTCIDISTEDDICKIINSIFVKEKIDVILIDECQFLTPKHVDQLVILSDYYDIPILCFGLKNTYVKGELFEGIKALIYFCNSIDEIKSTCEYCNHKATQNLRIVNGKPIYSGETVHIGDIKEGTDYYVSVCRFHYYKPELNILD